MKVNGDGGIKAPWNDFVDTYFIVCHIKMCICFPIDIEKIKLRHDGQLDGPKGSGRDLLVKAREVVTCATKITTML
uniref:Uncharacterized protein n=1 Tax=Amphimedon queenslandica TaxID=400682 RepID=A0A1X7VUA2_AMPQE